MSLRNIAVGGLMQSDDVQQIVDLLNGTSGKGQPVELIALDDAVNYVLTVKNLSAPSKAIVVLNHDNTPLLSIDDSGLRFSPDGIAFGLTPMVAGGALLVGGAATIASASNLNLGSGPTAGTFFQVTGTTTINSITATTALAGRLVVFTFLQSNLKIADNVAGSNLRLDGNFFSIANASTIALLCDGTHWVEVARAGGGASAARLRSAATFSIGDSTLSPISWATADYNNGAIWSLGTNPTRITPGDIGIYRISGTVSWAGNATGYRRIALSRNATPEQELATSPGFSATVNRQSFNAEVTVSSATDYFELVAFQTSGAPLNVVGGTSLPAETVITLRRVGNV